LNSGVSEQLGWYQHQNSVSSMKKATNSNMRTLNKEDISNNKQVKDSSAKPSSSPSVAPVSGTKQPSQSPFTSIDRRNSLAPVVVVGALDGPLPQSQQPSITPINEKDSIEDTGSDETPTEAGDTIDLTHLHAVLSTPFQLVLAPFASKLDVDLATEIVRIYDKDVVYTLQEQQWAHLFVESGGELSVRLSSHILGQRVVDTIIGPPTTATTELAGLEYEHSASESQNDPFRTRRRRHLSHFPRHQEQLFLAVEQTAYFTMMPNANATIPPCAMINQTTTTTTSTMQLNSSCSRVAFPTAQDLDLAIAASFRRGRDINLEAAEGDQYDPSPNNADTLTHFEFSRFLNTSSSSTTEGNGDIAAKPSNGASSPYEHASPNWLYFSLIFGCGIIVVSLFFQSLVARACFRKKKPRQTYGDHVNDDDPDYSLRNMHLEAEEGKRSVESAMDIMEQYNKELASYKKRLDKINRDSVASGLNEDISAERAMQLNEQYARVSKLYRTATYMWGNINKTYQSQVCEYDPSSERHLSFPSMSASRASKSYVENDGGSESNRCAFA
jgi:hypothetical protein